MGSNHKNRGKKSRDTLSLITANNCEDSLWSSQIEGAELNFS